MRFLGVWCFVVCFGTQDEDPLTLDSYCQTYQQVVRDSKELEPVTKLPRALRDRIQGNDLEFLCRCQGWKADPRKAQACGSTRQ